MKTNLKSGNAITRLLLAHGEKLGIAAILVCTGLIVWSALGGERLEKESSQLDNLANQTKAQIASFTWDDIPVEEKPIAKPLPPVATRKISTDAYARFQGSFNPPISDPVTLRTDPLLLAPMDLEVNSDSGLWASANPEMIKQKMLEAEKERKREELERAAARERASREGEGGRGGRGGGEGGYGGGGEGYGGRAGIAAGRGAKTARDAPIVVRPRGGAQLQGFEDIQAKAWVTVLAKVPIEAQTQLYVDSLSTSRGYSPRVDIPQYKGYQVERAEVTSQGVGEWEQVAQVNSRKLIEEISTYPVNVQDVIDPDVKHPLLTHPLPPLILREWGERVSHSSMPLAEEKARLEAEEREQPEDETEEPAKATGEVDMFAEPDRPRDGGRRGGGEYGAMAGRGGGRAYGGGMGRGGGYGGGEYGGGRGGEYGGGEYGGGRGGEYGGGEYGGGRGGEYGGGRGGYASLGRGSDATLAEFVWDNETPYILFRYFDNTVKSGRSYRYRVRLVMRDVNHQAKPKYLDPTVSQRREESGNKSYRWTDWSDPSPVASVPLPARVYLVSVKPAKESSYTSEPEAELMVKALNSEFAAEIARTEEFGRGSVINIFEKAKVIWANRLKDEDIPSFPFLTGITVLDFDGGEKLSRDMQSTARALLMDAAGHLYVQNEMDDLETIDEYESIIEGAKNDRNRGGGRGGYGGGGEYGGGEYGGRGAEY